MAEEKEEKKKPGIVRRIIKWIGLGLLTLLIILGLLFQAPWKAVTLLLIIMSACTVLPKPARKWFWLSAGVVIIALVIWVFLPEDTEGWRPYTFEEEAAALEAKRAIPDEENAAIIYNQLLEDYNEAAFEPNFLDPNLEGLTRMAPWSSKEHPEVAQWLKQHEDTIAKLIEASKIEKCRFPIYVSLLDFDKHISYLSPMRRWAYLLMRSANNDIAESRPDEALEKYIAVLQMGSHQYQQPLLIHFLVGTALEALSTNQFKRVIVTCDATETHLNVIKKALAEIRFDWNSDLPRILDHEKLLLKGILGTFYAINPEGKIRLNPGIASREIMAQLPEDIKDEEVITYWHERGMKASTILGWFGMPSTPQKAEEIIDAEYERLYAMARPDYDWNKQPAKPSRWIKLNYRYLVELLVEISAPGYYKIHDLYLRLAADKRASRIIIALRRYKDKNGNWPESLDDVKPLASAEIFVDPINSSSFVYKPSEENFTLYSKGKNNIDEEGKGDGCGRDGCGKEKTEADDWLIWPKKGYKAKEESTDAEQQ